MAFYTNSYGPITSVKTKYGAEKSGKRGHKRRVSTHKQLNLGYDIHQHVFIGSSSSLDDMRILINVRLKEKSVDSIRSAALAGYVAKVGSDYYIEHDGVRSEYNFYRREKSKRKKFKNFLPADGVEDIEGKSLE